jgi:hypothetical protein
MVMSKKVNRWFEVMGSDQEILASTCDAKGAMLSTNYISAVYQENNTVHPEWSG